MSDFFKNAKNAGNAKTIVFFKNAGNARNAKTFVLANNIVHIIPNYNK